MNDTVKVDVSSFKINTSLSLFIIDFSYKIITVSILGVRIIIVAVHTNNLRHHK